MGRMENVFNTAVQVLKTCLGPRYTDFKGRASRTEFWFFSLWVMLINLCVSGLVSFLPPKVGAWGSLIISLGLFLPNLSVTVRRFHDRNLRGWWLLVPLSSLLLWGGSSLAGGAATLLATLLSLVMCLGYLLVLCLPGEKGPNRFGPDPLADGTGHKDLPEGRAENQ